VAVLAEGFSKMDPNLTYHIVLNATNASLAPTVINVTLNPSLNATLTQPPQSVGQNLMQGGGTFLAGIIALISFMWVNLRGPRIVCSPIRYMTLIRTPHSSNVIPKFILSNIGGSSGVVEFIVLNLARISPGYAEYRFVSFFDGSIENLTPETQGTNQITSLDSPVLPFVIEKGNGIVKVITFANSLEDFNFIKGEYNIEIKILLQSHHGILKRIFDKLNSYRGKNGEREITILTQSFAINEDIQVKTARSAMIIDPATDKLEF